VVAENRQGDLVGQDFRIPTASVLMLDMVNSVNQWRPE
jgi:hypothetical protein